MKTYAEELAKFYGIEKSSSKQYHTITTNDGKTKELNDSNFEDIFNTKSFLFNYGNGNIPSQSAKIIIKESTKITTTPTNKKQAETLGGPVYKYAA